MAEQNQNPEEVVTLAEAVDTVKNWAKDKDYEKVKQGCEEILAVDAQNKEIRDLLDLANKSLSPNIAPAAAAKEPETAPAPAPKPTPIPSPAIMPVKEEVNKEPLAEEKTPKNSRTGQIVVIVVFVLILGGLIFSFTQGWLNPIYDWILGLFGL